MNAAGAIAVAGSVFAGIAAAIHVYIWVLESVLWTKESTRRTFGVKTADDANTLRGMAYNQGFYNLFLALGVVVGLVLLWSGLAVTGLVLTLFACLCMVLAASVLLSSNRRMLRAALVQGAAPLVAVALLGVALAQLV
jgi:putative membrane protein